MSQLPDIVAENTPQSSPIAITDDHTVCQLHCNIKYYDVCLIGCPLQSRKQ